MAFVTVEEIRDYTKVQSTEWTDEALESLSVSLSERFMGLTNTQYEILGTVTDKLYKGTDYNGIILEHSPIVSITALSIDNNGDYTYTALTVADDIIINNEAGIVYLKSTAEVTKFTQPTTNPLPVKISYTWGTASVPEDVKLVVLEMIAEQIHSDPVRKQRVKTLITQYKRNHASLV